MKRSGTDAPFRTVFRAVLRLSIFGLVITLGIEPALLKAQPALPTGIPEDQLFGTALKNSKWPSSSISVCWESPLPSDPHVQNVIQNAVHDTWEANSSVRFTGWSACVLNSPGIHIQISDQWAETMGIGKYLDQRPNGMILTSNFAGRGSYCDNVDFCTSALAVHEFGHALGFTHEQNRDDAPPECKRDQQGIHGDYELSKYDPSSVMNYCNKQWLGNGKLSALDILSVQKFYGQ